MPPPPLRCPPRETVAYIFDHRLLRNQQITYCVPRTQPTSPSAATTSALPSPCTLLPSNRGPASAVNRPASSTGLSSGRPYRSPTCSTGSTGGTVSNTGSTEVLVVRRLFAFRGEEEPWAQDVGSWVHAPPREPPDYEDAEDCVILTRQPGASVWAHTTVHQRPAPYRIQLYCRRTAPLLCISCTARCYSCTATVPHLIILLPMARCGVHQPCARLCRDVVPANDLHVMELF